MNSRLSQLPRSRVALIAIVFVAALAAGGWYWVQSGARRATENAYINARVTQVSSLVMGPIVRIAVQENQYVHKGDVLFELDRRPFEATLHEAEARLAQARQGTRQDVSEVVATQADAQRQVADLANAQANLHRTQDLVARNFVSRQAADDARARVSTAEAGLAAAQARVSKAQAAVSGASHGGATPAVAAAEAEVDRAKLDLEHAVVRAAEDGWVSNLELSTGTVVSPGTPLFALVVDHTFWIDANFKETELAGIRPGLPATIEIDMYPDHVFHGRVESLAGGTGAAFSLLPPQNATGNWVKVAQRVPVRIVITDPDPALPLRKGATATVTVALK